MTITMKASESPFWRDELEECASCRDLGACCYFAAKIEVKGKRIAVKSVYRCPHLEYDDGKGLCSRYETRHEVSWCGKVGDPNVDWPDFCVHCNSIDNMMFNSEQLGELGLSFDEVQVITKQVDALVKEGAMEEYGLEL